MFNSQSALHTSPLRASYGVFLWRFWRKLTALAAKQRSVIFVTNSVEPVSACIIACIVVFEIWCVASSVVCMIICGCQSNVLKHVIHVHVLTHWGRVNHICVSKLSHHWFRKWLVARSVPSHYLSQCWYTMNWIFKKKGQWNYYRNWQIFFQENAFEIVVCEMVAILSRH